MTTEPIGFIGLGAMGAPMAQHLARSGVPVLVYDINPKAVRSVVDCGARGMKTPRAIADRARLVFTCLPSLEALREVVLGKEGLINGRAIRTYVDCSTTGAQFAREMATALQAAGIRMLDAPITGNVITAGNGKLGVMCSGPRAAFRHARPVLERLASAMVLCTGPQSGRAQTLKLLNNLLSATGMAASCEAFILGMKAGLDPRVMLEVVNAGEASSSASRNKFARSVLPRQFDFGARMAITIKDITTSVKECEDLGVPVWIARAIREQWHYAISQGAAERDGTTLVTYLEKWAGIEVRADMTARTASIATKARASAIRKVVLICHERWRPALAARLRMLTAVECDLVGVRDGESAAAAVGVQLRARGQAPVVNLCPMPLADARMLASLQGKHAFIDAPLTGTLADARRGTLMVLASGRRADFDALLPLLQRLGKRVFYVDARPGMAQLMHHINGALFSTLFAATCEAFVAGAKAGLTPDTMTRVMGIETGRNAASAHIMPEQIATRRFRHGKRTAEALQELDAISAEAARLGVTNWVTEKVRLLYRLGAQLGSPNDDLTRLITHYEAWANVKVKA